jgi:hypothetical protein
VPDQSARSLRGETAIRPFLVVKKARSKLLGGSKSGIRAVYASSRRQVNEENASFR